MASQERADDLSLTTIRERLQCRLVVLVSTLIAGVKMLQISYTEW